MSTTATFINPPAFNKLDGFSNMPSYAIGDTVKVQWSTNAVETQLWLIRDGQGLTCPELNLDKVTCEPLFVSGLPTSWNWKIRQPKNYTSTIPIYYLLLQDTSAGGPVIGLAHYMNVLPTSLITSSSISSSSSVSSSSQSSTSSSSGVQPVATSTLSTSATSASQTLDSSNFPGATSSQNGSTATLTTTATPIPSSATPAPVPSSNTPQGIPDSTKWIIIGVIIGITVLLIVIIGLVVWLVAKSKIKKRKAAAAAAHHGILDGTNTERFSSYLFPYSGPANHHPNQRPPKEVHDSCSSSSSSSSSGNDSSIGVACEMPGQNRYPKELHDGCSNNIGVAYEMPSHQQHHHYYHHHQQQSWPRSALDEKEAFPSYTSQPQQSPWQLHHQMYTQQAPLPPLPVELP